MKSEELQKYIQNLSPDLYSFAYVLIPDDLQASQLMIDGVQSFLVQKKALIDRMISPKNKTAKNYFDEVKISLLRIIFELSKRRYQQLKISFQDVEQGGGFFSLDFEEKAVLYLKEKANFELEQIEYLTGLTRAEVMAHLYSARIKVIELIPNNQHARKMESGGIA